MGTPLCHGIPEPSAVPPAVPHGLRHHSVRGSSPRIHPMLQSFPWYHQGLYQMTRRQHHLVPSAVLNASRDICAMEYQSRPQFHLLYRTVYAICAITYTVRSTQTENSNLQLVMTKDYALGGASNKNPIHEPFYVTMRPKSTSHTT